MDTLIGLPADALYNLRMDFGVKRLNSELGTARLYHLYDKWDRLRFVADQGSPWLTDDPQHYVRLARTDGHLVATLNLPWEDVEEGKRPLNYAVLVDHAVYAVFEVHEGKRPLIVVEVEESRWLVAPDPHSNDFNLFDNAPSSFRLRTNQADEITNPPIGSVRQQVNGYDFVLDLPGKRPLRRPAILSLALVVLVDRFGETAVLGE
ncbi:MAG: hypothetical protein R3C62_03940 [Chloroflexota bacterium]